MSSAELQQNKIHRNGRDPDQGNKKKLHVNGHNAKAFAVSNPGKLDRMARRTQDIKERKFVNPVVDRTPEEPPPVLVAVVGPKGTGKTTLIKSLVRRFTKHTLKEINGPVTVVSGKRRRLTFFECGTDLNSMIDIAKCADLILLMIDGNFGFEMETMEFLNILAPHGFPRILGITTHLDLFKSVSTMRASKKALKHRFWTEVYKGAKLFYLSGVINGRYPDREILNLARFISIMKFRPLKWRNEHPYLLADRVVDITHPNIIEQDEKADRTVTLYGYLRGTPMAAENAKVHIPGVGDATIREIERLTDPCATPYAIKMEEAKAAGKDAPKRRRRLDEKMKTIYAPMSDVGGVMIDKDAVYIDVGTNNFDANNPDHQQGEGERLVTSLQSVHKLIGAPQGGIQLFSSAEEINDIEDAASDDDSGFSEDDDEQRADVGRESLRQGHSAGSQATIFEDKDVGDAVAADSGESDADLEFINDEEDELDEQSRRALRWMDSYKSTRTFHKTWTLARVLYLDNISPEDALKRWNGEETEESIEEDDDDDGDDGDNLFTKVKSTSEEDERDTPLLSYPADLSRWSDPDVVETISKAFYREVRLSDVNKSELGSAGNDESDGAMDEGFEDLEAEDADTDEPDTVQGSSSKGAAQDKVRSIEEQREENAKRKEQLRQQIEEIEADDRDNVAADDPEAADDADGTWFDNQKARIAKQLEINKAEYDQMDDATRDQIEGFRAGTYVRLVFEGVPAEFVEYFDPAFPVLVGGLLPNEERMGYSQVRLKRHRWHKKILKTNDPLIISLGWRRFQTCPIYTTSDSRTRNRMLKYTPEHMYCTATFWGPLVSPNTGFCAVTSVAENEVTAGFRICATGTVQEVDQHVEIVKKLKLVGHPYKIYKNSAFIKDMFSSALEVAKFEGGQIKTVSGIRGQIKRALAKPEGNFRATFEDKILMSDIVILRAWFPIFARKFYNPVTSLLLDNKREWCGMRLTGTVRAQKGLETPAPADSSYSTIERAQRRFHPLQVPKSLQQQLPFNSQLQQMKPQSKQTYMQKRAVVLGGQEKQLRDLMVKVGTLRNEKDAKLAKKKAESRAKIAAKQAKLDAMRAEKRKKERKEYFTAAGKRQADALRSSSKKARH